MSWIRRRKPRAEDVDAEIQFHLNEEVRLRGDRGEGVSAARDNARRAFGNIALAREDTRAVWTWTALEQFLQDIRSGCRILTTAPGLSLAAVMLIALVIGGNTTVFSMAHGFLTKPRGWCHRARPRHARLDERARARQSVQRVSRLPESSGAHENARPCDRNVQRS